MPAASYYESRLCRTVLDELGRDYVGEVVSLIASTSNFDEFAEDKRVQYSAGTPQGKVYRRRRPMLHFPWMRRMRGATADISVDWSAALEDGRADEAMASISKREGAPADIARRWEELPERLEGAAFIVDNVVPLLLGAAVPSYGVKSSLHGMINSAYFGSYVRDLGAAVFKDMIYLEPTFPLESADPPGDLHFRNFREFCRSRRLLAKILACDAAGLLSLRGDLDFRAAQLEYAAQTEGQVAERQLYAIVPFQHRFARAAGGLEGVHKLKSSTVQPTALRVLIVNALPMEAAAVRASADEVSDAFGDNGSHIYRVCAYQNQTSGEWRHVLQVTLATMGKAAAAATAAAALQAHPSIDHVVVVGIAGCCPNRDHPNEHVRLGDVVVSDAKGIIEYDFIKMEEGHSTRRHSPQVPSAHMLQAFNQLKTGEWMSSFPWEAILDSTLKKLGPEGSFGRPDDSTDVLHDGADVVPHPKDPVRRSGRPRIFGGAVATADILLKAPNTRDELRDTYGVKAIEMEGSAVQSASWLAGKDAIIVRGASDYADGYKADGWQPYAALAAAAYARSLIEAMPSEWFS